MSAGVEGQCKCGGFAMEGSSDCRDCACAVKDEQQVEEHYEETDEALCIRCGDETFGDSDKCSACLYDDEIEHQVERIIERMHGIDN